jgi:hypothetical protein
MAPKVTKYVVLAVIVVNVAIIAYVFLGSGTPPAQLLPNPNGYDDFVRAGQMVKGDPDNYAQMSKQELAALVATNAGTLKLLRLGLSRECVMPVQYETNYHEKVITELSSFKAMALLLRGEGLLAELEGRSNDAANIYLEGTKFGQESTRGGLLMSKLVDVACESIAMYPLTRLMPGLGAEQCRETAKVLESIDTKEEPLPEILQREKLWTRETFGFKMQLVGSLFNGPIHDTAVSRMQTTQHTRRKLMIDFAARAYELEKGKPPQSVTDLVPDYLKAVPKDPVTEKEMGLGR